MRSAAVFVVLATLLASSSVAAGAPAAAATTTAVDVLHKLPVASVTHGSTYDRAKFNHWIDADNNKCNTRYEVLIAEATKKPTVAHPCTLSGGAWTSLFDGVKVSAPSNLDVDHMVPLKEAWISGAASWTNTQREKFANDLGVDYSLIAVTKSSNSAKGARDPATWMPPVAGYHCTYATEWVLIKYRWGLSVDTAEQQAIANVLSGSCGKKTVTLPMVMAAPKAPAKPTPAKTAPTFTDIGASSKFAKEIAWLATSGVTTGYADGTFKPHAPITRDAMAAFMYRLAGKPAYTPPKRSAFTDINPKSKFFKEIMWLSSTGVTTGYADGTFKPHAPVTRDAMAAFMYRLAGKPAFNAPKQSPFKDMTTKSQFYRETSWLAASGVSTGWADGSYRPFQHIERNAMAAFMYRFQRSVGTGNNLVPANPGNTKNCSDFSTWRQAQTWYNRYFPYYGDVAQLDGNNDGWVCVSLPGAR